MKLYYDQSQDKVRSLPEEKHHDLECIIAYALSKNEEKAFKEYIKPIIDRGVSEDDVLVWVKAIGVVMFLEDAKMEKFIEIVKKNYTIY